MSALPIPRKLTQTRHQKQTPVSCPEGEIVYAEINGAHIRLRVIAADGSGDRLLLPERDDWIQQHPAWSPDGRRLAFTGNEGFRNGQISVYVCEVDGLRCTGVRPLITPGQNCWPAWSPDGKRLAYIGVSHQLMLADADGGNRRRPLSLAGIQFHPNWTPDGEWILFASSHAGYFQVYKIRPDGRELTRLSRGDGYESRPAVSPDGRWVAYSTRGLDGSGIVAAPIGGGEPIRITTTEALDDYPSWSRDGSRLHFVSTRDGGFELYAVDPRELLQR